MKRSMVKFFSLLLLGSALLSVPAFSSVAADLAPQDALTAHAQQITGDVFRFRATSPLGVRVVSVNQPPGEMLTAIDQGFTDLFAVARRHNYGNHLNYSDYTVFIAKPDRLKDSAGNYSPDLAVPAGQYAGSDYDQGGFIYAAGMVLSFNPSAFVFAEHTQSLQRVRDVVRFEGEHIVLFYNDRKLYEQTADHSKGGGHPILQ